MLYGKVPGVGRARLKEEATITLRTFDGRAVTRLLSDVSREPFIQGGFDGRSQEWRLHDGRTVTADRSSGAIYRLINVLPMFPNGGITFDRF